MHGAKTPEQVAEMRGRGAGVSNLNEFVKHELLPTPRASANENRQTKRTPSQEAGDHGLCLAAEVMELLPTPSVTNSHGNHRRGGDRAGELLLPGVVVDLLPTPSVADATGGHLSRSGDRSGELLLPGIVRELSGATRPRSGNRSASSGG
jgi:hypothetical protein